MANVVWATKKYINRSSLVALFLIAYRGGRQTSINSMLSGRRRSCISRRPGARGTPKLLLNAKCGRLVSSHLYKNKKCRDYCGLSELRSVTSTSRYINIFLSYSFSRPHDWWCVVMTSGKLTITIGLWHCIPTSGCYSD